MEPWLIVLIAILAVIVVFLAIIIIRTVAFRPKKSVQADISEVNFDKAAAVSNLQTLVRFKTVSSYDPEQEDDAEFKKLIAKLPELYPAVFEKCEFKELQNKSYV